MRKLYKGLVYWYDGLYLIIKKVVKVSYKLDLLSRFKLHPIFYVSCLNPYQESMEVSTCGESKSTPLGITTTYDKEVEVIFADCVIKRQSYKQLIKEWVDHNIQDR